MADTYTAELNLTKPGPGGSTNTWGQKLNDDLDALDADVAETHDRLDALEQAAVLTSQVDITASTFGDITGLTATVEIGTYAFEVILRYQISTNDMILGVNGPAKDYVSWSGEFATSENASIHRSANDYDDLGLTVFTPTAATEFAGLMRGTVKFTASGTFAVRARRGSFAATVSFLPGCALRLRKID